MESFNDAFENFAKLRIKSQKIKETDYYDSNNILVCGVCHAKRQKYLAYQDKKVLVPSMCECEKIEYQKKEEARVKKQHIEKVNILRRLSLMDVKYENASFKKYYVDEYNKKCFTMCKNYAQNYDEMMKRNQGLLLWGKFGTGKSYTAACIANYLMEQGKSVVMTSFVKILEYIPKSAGDEETRILERIENAKLLVLDDFGAERNTDYALEKVYNIVDTRYRKKLPMIVTTNFTLQQMNDETDVRYGRLYDRIFEVCFPIQFVGESFRKTEAKKRYNDIKDFLMGNT